MDIILLERVEKLGQMGELVNTEAVKITNEEV